MIDKKTIKQFLYYIKGKLHYGLYYSPFDNFKLVGYMDIYWVIGLNWNSNLVGFHWVLTLYLCNSAFGIATVQLIHSFLGNPKDNIK